MFGRKNKVIKHGVLYGSRGIYVQTCKTCGCVYACCKHYENKYRKEAKS